MHLFVIYSAIILVLHEVTCLNSKGDSSSNKYTSKLVDSSHKILELIAGGDYGEIIDNDKFYGMISQRIIKSSVRTFSNETSIDFEEGSHNNCYLLKVHDNIEERLIRKFESLLNISGVSYLKEFSLGHDNILGFKICYSDREIPISLLNCIKCLEIFEKDQKIKATQQSIQKSAPWGLAALSSSYTGSVRGLGDAFVFNSTGKGVTIYVVDSGINVSHKEFSGRATIGFELLDNAYFDGDCNGHGTEVASVIAGMNIGVAEEANIVSISVLDCDGEGTNSDLILAMDWIAKNRKGPSVVNLSVGGNKSAILDESVEALIRMGIPVIVAAGNSGVDACTQSPSSVANAIVVGAITKSRHKADFSNFGSCVDLFAPGKDIVVANARYKPGSKVSRFNYASGTSLSAPFVTGIAALILENEPQISPLKLKDRILEISSHGILSGNLRNSPNILAQAPRSSQNNYIVFKPDIEDEENLADTSGMSAVSITLMIVGIIVVVSALLIISIIIYRRYFRS